MNTKKLISLALSVCMVSTAAMATAITADAAAANVDVTVADVSAKAGEKIEIAVNADIPSPGAAGFEFALTYDTSFMEIKEIKEGKLIGTGASAAEVGANGDLSDTMISGGSYSCLDYIINDKGSVSVMWSTGLEDQKYWASGSGEIITIVATIKDGAKGSSKVSIEPIRSGGTVKFGYVDYSAGSEVAYGVTPKAGTITVGGDETSATTAATETEKPTESTTTSGTTAQPSGDTMLGDATLDGEVDVRDVALISQYLVKLKKLEGQAFINADVNSDGSVQITDLTHLKRFLIKDIAKL